MIAAEKAALSGSQTVERALRILDALTDHGNPMRLSDVAQAVGLNISTTSRLLSSLARYRYVIRDPDTGLYRLGYKILTMAQVVHEQAVLPVLAQPVLTTLMEATGETATVNVLHDDQAMIVARVECRSPLRIVSQVGARGPLYCTAAGKLLLAYVPAATLDRLLGLGMPARTARTITTPERMHQELAETRRRGYAIDAAEREDGLIGIAAPVRDATGQVVATCGISGSALRMSAEAIPTLTDHVVAAAATLSQCLGWRRPNEDGVGGVAIGAATTVRSAAR